MEHETVWTLLTDRAHWEFELILMVLFDVLIGAMLWPWLKRRFRKKCDEDSERISRLEEEFENLKEGVGEMTIEQITKAVESYKCGGFITATDLKQILVRLFAAQTDALSKSAKVDTLGGRCGWYVVGYRPDGSYAYLQKDGDWRDLSYCWSTSDAAYDALLERRRKDGVN